jgi:hypothetical protein
VLLSEHDVAVCGDCGSNVWYGVQEEPTGWKVVYVCTPQTGCGSEWNAGWVSRGEVESIDEVYERAESMWTGAES